MDPQLYSETLAPFEGVIANPLLLRSIRQLADFYEVGRLLKWDEDRIGIPVIIPVELPPLGNFDGINIRSEERVLLVVHPEKYPTAAPDTFPDRLDFPKDRLAHLYIDKQGRPPEFCLIRGNDSGLNEWYANKQMKDLATRISNWLRDAAAGTLSENAGQWEPLRLRGYNGTLKYDYDAIAKIVNENASFEPDQHFAVWLCERFGEPDDGYGWTFVEQVTKETIAENFVKVYEEGQKKDDAPGKKYLYLSYILWSASKDSYSNYNVVLPSTWGDLKTFCAAYGVETAALEKELTTDSKNIYITTPVVVAIRRPRPLIGYSGSLEFLNFQIRVEETQVTDGKIADEAMVKFKRHIQPMTLSKATELSGFSGGVLCLSALIGCGALGARIGLHFAKSGTPPWIVVDPGVFSVHNFLRHPLSSSYNGLSKARALSREIKRMYEGASVNVKSLKETGQVFIRTFSDDAPFVLPWLFDFTASPAFQNDLVAFDIANTTRIVKGYITDFGNLGVLLFDGKGQNPRIDDLQVLLYAQSIENDVVSAWLGREAAAPGNASFINIGVGCHTETTVLPNDIVDLHAALMSSNIKIESKLPNGSVGKVQLHDIELTPIFHTTSMQWEFKPLSVFSAVNDPAWQIRFASGVVERMQALMRKATPQETGGVFIGCANYKTSTIHVVDLIDAPPDSQANEVCFIRGIDGLPDKVRQINERSGGQLGYIGEWHSHPEGPEGMSATDAATATRFHRAYRGLTTPLPVFLTILTPDNVLPFVFE